MRSERIKVKPTRKSLLRFEYFSKCNDALRLPAIAYIEGGYSAAECFHAHETYGVDLPTCEPELLSMALNGKQWHGVDVTNLAEDYIGRVLFASDLKSNYPAWVRKDVLGRAKQLSRQKMGWVPKYVETGEDFTTLVCE